MNFKLTFAKQWLHPFLHRLHQFLNHCSYDIYSILYRELLIIVKAKQPIIKYQNQQKCLSLELGAILPKHGNVQVYFYMVPYHNGATENHPISEIKTNNSIYRLHHFLLLVFSLLTSKLAKQYQQKTCLQRLHIICAQPSSFSIGTAHMGQHLMRSLSKGIPISSWPSAAKRRLCSSQVIFGCH